MTRDQPSDSWGTDFELHFTSLRTRNHDRNSTTPRSQISSPCPHLRHKQCYSPTTSQSKISLVLSALPPFHMSVNVTFNCFEPSFRSLARSCQSVVASCSKQPCGDYTCPPMDCTRGSKSDFFLLPLFSSQGAARPCNQAMGRRRQARGAEMRYTPHTCPCFGAKKVNISFQ